MPTMQIPEFLLARIAEDEAEARRWIARRKPWAGESFDVFHAGTEERVLAECEVKRRLVEQISRVREWVGSYAVRDFVLQTLATIYADHPDYREEWKPWKP
jgi:hypothetical protein